MPMKFMLKFRRDRWVSQVISNGKLLRQMESARAGVDGETWPHDAEYLDNVITRLTHRRDTLLNKLKETAPSV